MHRSRVYAVMRAWATIIQRDLQVEAIIADLYAGRPVAYTTFLAYDEVAHHSGIERADALVHAAPRSTAQIGRIAAAAESAPRPYEIVVLCDHGQSQGATFLQRYGMTLEQVVHEAAGADSTRGRDRSEGRRGARGSWAPRSPRRASRRARWRAPSGAVARAPVDGEVRLGEGERRGHDAGTDRKSCRRSW